VLYPTIGDGTFPCTQTAAGASDTNLPPGPAASSHYDMAEVGVGICSLSHYVYFHLMTFLNVARARTFQYHGLACSAGRVD